MAEQIPAPLPPSIQMQGNGPPTPPDSSNVMSRLTYPRPYIILTVFVCISAVALGAVALGVFFGIPILHEMTYSLVIGIGGVLVGLFWSYMMLQHTRKGSIGTKLVAKGVFWGIVAGAVDTLPFCVAWWILDRPPSDFVLMACCFVLFSPMAGVVVGAINGLVCGLLWNALAKKYPIGPK